MCIDFIYFYFIVWTLFTKQRNNEMKMSSPLFGQFSLIHGLTNGFWLYIGNLFVLLNCKSNPYGPYSLYSRSMTL